jgi:hypothetical protein
MVKAKKQVAATAPVVQVTPVQPQGAQVGGNAAGAAPKQRYAPTTWGANWVIGNVVPNPKRGKSQARFALLQNGMLVSEYGAALVAAKLGNATTARLDLQWGVPRGQFTIDPPQGS